jgi:hypothetical protein
MDFTKMEAKMIQKRVCILVMCVALTFTFIPTVTVKGEGALPVLVGIYPSAELYQTVGEINTLDNYFRNDTGPQVVSIAGTFLDLESPWWLVTSELNSAWDNGYMPFVNLGAGTMSQPWTARQIAEGEIDLSIRNWADIFRGWSNNNEKRAFIAPLQEMNGDWITYKDDPANYKRAFLRIQQIFKEEGVPASAVSWVFAPNAWNNPGKPQNIFENFYPGDSAVDVVGFSSFNFGTCWSYTASESYEQIYKPYLDRMSAMAPGKPIFIAEIGSVAVGVDRAAWLTDTLTKIGAYPGVRAILYFNRIEDTSNISGPVNCNPVDYSLDASSREGKDAFKAQVTQSPYGYWSPNSTEMIDIAFNRPIATFEDVWPASAFSGKSTTPFYQPWVERLVNANVTGGCNSAIVDFIGVFDYTYRYYCPNDNVTRAQMAIFLERGIQGSSFIPAVVPITFADIFGHWAQYWIEALKLDGVTAGCGNGNYCPENSTTRAQMAVFLLRAKYGAGYAPPPVGVSTGFTDVPVDYWAAAWIKQLAVEGITSGCSLVNYCPDSSVTRGQMAIFLVRTFNLP